MIEVADRVCDIDCVLFYNGKCVTECSEGQERIGYVCMDKTGVICPYDYAYNQLGQCEKLGSLEVQVEPDGSKTIVSCTDGIITDDNECVMRCPLDTVWIERNCYPLEMCENVVQIEHRNVCVDGSVSEANRDVIIDSECD